ncbi:MAG: nucleotidyltransferase domain-containing protein [DPANN group archaeon]|nr:nucleotidyltransferase domain-containing protein [DPANN group archaeon]
MYIDNVLGSKVKIRLLSVLVNGKTYSTSALAEEAHASLPEISRQGEELTQLGLIKMHRIGKTKQYSINKEHFLVKTLKHLFKGLTNTYETEAKRTAASLVRKHNITSIILIGSVAEKQATVQSDIDLLIVLPNNEIAQNKKEIISEINQKHARGLPIIPIVLSEKDYLTRLKKDPFIIKAHAHGVVLHGKKPKRFG